MSLSYRTILTHLLSYRFTNPLRPAPLQRDHAKRGGLFEFLETRELFSGAPPVTNFSEPNPGPDSRGAVVTIALDDFRANFSDSQAGATLADVEFVTLPANGNLTINGVAVTANTAYSASQLGQNSFVYTPNPNFTGTDTFQWNGSNGDLNNSSLAYADSPANLSITVVNHPPVLLANASINIVENDPNPLTLSSFSNAFTDTDGDSLQSIQIQSLPSSGNLTLNGSPVVVSQIITSANISLLTYTPNTSFTGTDTFTWNASDGLANSSLNANYTLTVANTAPTASNISITVAAGTNTSLTTTEFNAAFQDTDAPLDSLQTITIATLPANGNLTLSGSPVALNQIISTASIPTLIYTSNSGSTGTDTFTFTVSDGKASSAPATASLVATSPTLSTITANVLPNISSSTSIAFTVGEFTAAFQSAANLPLQSIEIVTLPANGIISLNGTPINSDTFVDSANITHLTYAPNLNFVGSDTFTWNATDGGSFSLSPQNFNISVASSPSVTDFTITGLAHATNIPVSLANFTANFTDPDSSANNTVSPNFTVKITQLPQHGFLSIGGDTGSYVHLGQVLTLGELGALEYTQTANGTVSSGGNETVISGTDTFGYTAGDVAGLFDTTPTSLANSTDPDVATDGTAAIVTINATANVAPVVSDVVANTSHVTNLSLSSANFLAGFFDANGDSLTAITFVTLPTHGTLTLAGAPIGANIPLNASSLTLVQYVPNHSYVGTDTFTWKAFDGTVNSTNTANFTITDTNRAPFNSNLTISAVENATNPFTIAQFNVSFADQDLGDVLKQIKITSLPSHGTLSLGNVALTSNSTPMTIDAANITQLTYTPNTNYTGTDSFGWVASDGFDFAANGALVNITVANHPPVVKNITIPVAQNATGNFSVANFSAGFSDVDAPLDTMQQIKIVTLPSHGNLTLNGTPVTANQIVDTANISLLQYTPNSGFVGTDTFSYNAFDGKQFADSSATASLPITFPTVSNISFPAIAPGSNVTLNKAAFVPGFSDTVANTSLQSVKIVTLPLHGTLALNGTPVTANQIILGAANLANLIYTPSGGFKGSDSFKYSASDAADGTDFASGSANFNIIVDVLPILLSNGTKSASLGTPVSFTATDFSSLFNFTSGESLTSITITALPANGTLKLGSTAVSVNQVINAANITRLTYTPNTVGADSFTFTENDGFASSPSASFVIANHSVPVVSNISIPAAPGAAVPLTLEEFTDAFTDTDANATLATIKFTTLPAHGNLTLSGDLVTANTSISAANIPNLVYTPTGGFKGSDTFTWSGSAFNSSNGSLQFADAAANITISQTFPTLSNISESGPSNGTVAAIITITSADFSNAFDDLLLNSQFQNVKITSLPTHGTLVTDGNPVTLNQTINKASLATFPIIYTPSAGYYGTDSFQFNEDDGTDSALASATVNLTSATPPIANPTPLNEIVGTPVVFSPGQFANGTAFTDFGNLPLSSITITALPTLGNLQFNGHPVTPNQTISASLLSHLSYTPTSGGSDNFQFTASDGIVSSSNTTFSLTNNTRPVLANITIPASNANISFNSSEFAAGFTDVDTTGDSSLQNIILTSLPSHGNLSYNGTLLTSANLATLGNITNSNISLLAYIPNPNYVGSDSFKCNAYDGAIIATSSATATLAIAAPVASNFTLPVIPAGINFTQVEFSNPPVFTDVVSTSQLRVLRIDTLPTHGSLTLSGVPVAANLIIPDSAIDNLTYTPAAGYHGKDSLRFAVSDGTLFSTSDATLTLLVDNAPTISDSNLTVTADKTDSLTLADFTTLSNYNDLDGEALKSITIVSLPGNGTLSLGGIPVAVNQVIPASKIPLLSYTPVPIARTRQAPLGTGPTPAESFTWTASDGLLSTAASTLTLSVNAPPNISNIALSTTTGTPVNLSLANFTAAFTDLDANGTPPDSAFNSLEQIKITSLPANGALLLNGVKIAKNQIIASADVANITYTGKTTFIGSDTFTYTASDGADFSAANATVAIAVAAPFDVIGNGVPIINGDTTLVAADFTDFGSWTILPDISMQKDTRTFTVQNSSNATITLGNITSSNPNFIVTASDANVSLANATIAPGGTLDITIEFAPTVAGKKTGSITITDSANVTLFTYTIQGNALLTTTVPTNGLDQNGNLIAGVVQYGDTKNGSGAGATNGQILGVKYTGYLADGTVFDASSLHGNTPFTFRLDDLFTSDSNTSQPYLSKDQTFGYGGVDGGVIAGWDYGLQGVKVGESRTLVIDSSAGYGVNGSPNLADPSRTVPPNSTLIFDIQVVSLSTKPQLGVIALNSARNFIAYVDPGQHTTSASDDTEFTLLSNQSSLSQTFLLTTNGTVDQSGASVSNWTFFGKKHIRITGPGAKDFSFSISSNELTVTFSPLHAGRRNATIHLLTTDPVHRDFSFDIQGNSLPTVDITTNFGMTKFPPTAITSGSGQTLTVPVVIVNSGNSPVPANSKTNVQLYVENAANQSLTLIQTLNNVNISGLGGGKTRKLNITTAFPASLGTGTYQINVTTNESQTLLPGAVLDPTLAVIPEATTSNDGSSISTTFGIVQGTHNLTGSITASTLSAVNGAVTGNISLSLRNSGTISLPKNETATVQLIAHPAGDAGTARDQILNAGFSISISQLGGGARTFTIPANPLGTLPSDSYIVEAIITPDQTLNGAANVTINSDGHGNFITLNV